MTLPGETIGTGAAPRCPDCNVMPRMDVYMSGAGYYIGTYCNCGPYSRESGYFRTRKEAERAFREDGYVERGSEVPCPGCPGGDCPVCGGAGVVST